MFVSGPTRLVANEPNATRLPSALIDGCVLSPLPCVPSLATLARSVLPLRRSRTNTSIAPSVSPLTRFVASESKAT
jgi:hypothetical protein